MAETIAGIPRKYAIVGGAVAVGILGYAWWKNGSAGASVTPDLQEAAADEYQSPLGNTGTNSSLDLSSNVDPDKIDTNAKWTQAAIEGLRSVGYDSQKSAAALGHLLAFKPPADSLEAEIMTAAKGMYGEPPVGGPYPIKEPLPNPTTPNPGAVTGLHAKTVGRYSILLDWNETSNADGYEVLVSGGGMTNKIKGVPKFSWDTVAGLKSGTPYTFTVRARNKKSGGPYGQPQTIQVATKK